MDETLELPAVNASPRPPRPARSGFPVGALVAFLVLTLVAGGVIVFLATSATSDSDVPDEIPGIPTAVPGADGQAGPGVVELPAEAPARWLVVDTENLYVRDGPGTTAEIIGAIEAGEPGVMVTGQRVTINGFEWKQVEYGDRERWDGFRPDSSPRNSPSDRGEARHAADAAVAGTAHVDRPGQKDSSSGLSCRKIQMQLGTRARLSAWLLAILVPVCIAGGYAIERIETRLEERLVADLQNLQRLEVARVSQALDDYAKDAQSLAAGPHLIDFSSATTEAILSQNRSRVVGGVNGFSAMDPLAPMPLQELADALLAKASTTGSEVVALRIVGPNGAIYGETAGFDWFPYDAGLLDEAMTTQEVAFGNAYRDRDGQDRLGLVVPILDAGTPVAALELETRLGPIVDLVVGHEGFGESSEAHIAQPTASGDAEFITPLRFRRDAAFNVVVPKTKGLPINQALQSTDGVVVWSPDYRSIDSVLAIQTVDATGWGLVVKIDEAEALAPVNELKRTLALTGVVGVAVIVGGWLLLVDPITRRLRRTALAAMRVAGGDYESPIDDRRSDEIGRMAGTIDKLATQLAHDIRIRGEIETRLRRQATHDDLTGLHNRQFASDQIDNLLIADTGEPLSLLFLDLDGFKSINDTYGHGIGDEVLAACGHRLVSIVPDKATVARWGGDEFVIVLPGQTREDADAVASRVHATFDQPIATTVGEHLIRFSVGCSTVSGDETVDDLLHRADDAMFSQKQTRSGRRTIAPSTLRTIEQALGEDRVDVWYQPIVDLQADEATIVGCEALLRIRDHRGTIIAPDTFVGEIQASQLGSAVDRAVIGRALGYAAELIESKMVTRHFQVSVNCGESFLRDAEAVTFLAEQLQLNGLLGQNLILEISEQSSILRTSMIDQVVDLGIGLAIDDVGLNQSNLDRLIDSHATIAKLDRRWLEVDDERGQTGIVLSHLIPLCHDLGLTVVAEGVELDEQFDRLCNRGVHIFQGHMFGRPAPPEQFTQLLENASSPFVIETSSFEQTPA